MDDLGANDPYRGMETGEDSIQPDFLSKGKEKAQDILGAVEQVAAMKGGGAPGKANPNAAKGGASKAGESGANAAKGAETKEKDGLYSGNKNAEINEDNASGGDGLKEIAGIGMGILAPILILIGLFFGLIALVVGLPIMMIGAIDYNLQTALGFKDTVGVIEKQGEYVTAEMAMNGEFPSGYASDLAQHGIDVGQLTANGDFYKTNVYIANIEEKDGMVAAAGGFSYISDEEGELAMLYEGEIIKASEFVAKVESDPKLYAAYSGAANLSAKYYYGKDATEAFSDMGITRGEFNSLYTTGNYELDEENFVATLNAFLDSNSDLGVGGRLDDNSDKPSEDGVEDSDIEVNNDDNERGGGTWSSEAVDAGIMGTTSDNTMEYITGWSVHEYEDCTVRVNGGCKIKKKIGPDFSDDATERATELLNSAVSASEPYQAANVFMGIEEPIQRARIGDNGPVNALMNVISKPSTVTYQNVQTGEMETNTTSILESTNFNAAVGEKPYSASEAANFAADRALLVAGMNGNDKIDGVIENTVVSSTGQSYSTSTSRNGKCWFFMTEEECEENKADEEVVSGVDQTLNEVIVEKNSNVFQSVIGANRVLQGGSYVSNTINKKALGSMPSDSEAIAKYDKVVEETVARKAEADRASLSPFDISSPNTFLGSIVHNLATMSLRNYSSSGGVSLAAVATSMTDNAISNLTNSASAEGMNQKFTTMLGTNCKTVKTTSTEGNLYCNSSNTNNTDYMDYTLDDWQETIIGDSIDEDGHILEDSALYQFVTMGMDRSPTVGVKSAEVCERYKGSNEKSLFDDILSVLSMYDACKGVEDKFATGAIYTRGPEGGNEENSDEIDVELFTAYMLYSQVRALMNDEESSVALVRENYYAKHPKDNSRSGVLARISGMTKQEAEIALAYNDYLNEIANYDSSSRYHFGAIDLGLESNGSILEAHSEKISGDFVAWYTKETEYSDLRTRNFVV